MAKISTFIIGIILVGIFAGAIGMYYADGATKYGASYNNSSFDGYDRMSEIQAQTAQINQTITNFDGASTIDIIGRFLQSGYSVIKITYSSFASFIGIGEAATAQVPGLAYFKAGLFLIAFVILIFVVVSILVGRDV